MHIECRYQNDHVNLSCFNTISRAELVAIHVALQEVAQVVQRADNTIHIATDSLGSIYGIAKVISRPQDITEHRQLHLLQSIAKAIEDASGVVHIWKVKGHANVHGNETADAAAVAVAKGEIPDNATVVTYERPSNCREDMYWPHVREAQQHIDKTTGTISQRTTYRPLANIMDALAAEVHPLKKLGASRQDGLYFQAWSQANREIAPQYSHMFMTSSKIHYKTRNWLFNTDGGSCQQNGGCTNVGKALARCAPCVGRKMEDTML